MISYYTESFFFCQKLHENERNWTEKGMRASLAPLLDPPLKSIVMYDYSLVLAPLPPPNARRKTSFVRSPSPKRYSLCITSIPVI